MFICMSKNCFLLKKTVCKVSLKKNNVIVATIDILEVWTITWNKYNNTGSLDGILEGQ